MTTTAITERKSAYSALETALSSAEGVLFLALVECFRNGWNDASLLNLRVKGEVSGDPRLEEKTAERIARVLSVSDLTGRQLSTVANWLAWAPIPEHIPVAVNEALKRNLDGHKDGKLKCHLYAGAEPTSPEGILKLGQLAMRSGENMATFAHLLVKLGAKKEHIACFMLGGTPGVAEGSKWSMPRALAAMAVLWSTGGFISAADMLPWVCATPGCQQSWFTFWFNGHIMDEALASLLQDNHAAAFCLQKGATEFGSKLIMDPRTHALLAAQHALPACHVNGDFKEQQNRLAQAGRA
jgi:hypothetical protein